MTYSEAAIIAGLGAVGAFLAAKNGAIPGHAAIIIALAIGGFAYVSATTAQVENTVKTTAEYAAGAAGLGGLGYLGWLIFLA